MKAHDLYIFIKAYLDEIVEARFTGKITVAVNFSQGGIGKIEISRKEVIVPIKPGGE